MQQTQERTLEKVICFELGAITLWSGRRKLKKEDLKLVTDDEIPPEALASLGSKRIIDPEEIADFEALKKEAHRECGKIGIRFLGGYAVPEEAAPELAAKLDDIGRRFSSCKSTFLADYDTTVADWIAAHPQWSSMLNTAALTRSEVDSKLNYGWSSFRVVAADEGSGDSNLNQGLKTEIGGLAGQLYLEIAKAASSVMDQSLLGRDRVSQKILSPIRTIRGKLQGLSFLDQRVKPLIETIDHVSGLLPQAGWIEGLALSALHGLIFILSSEDRMIAHGQMVVEGKKVEEAFEESVPGLAKEQETEIADEIAQALNGPEQQPQPATPQVHFNKDPFGAATAAIRSVNSNPFAEAVAAPPPVVRPANGLGLFS